MNNDNQLMALCQNIKTLRLSHNLTLKEMASIMGVTIQQLQSMEDNTFPGDLDVGVLFNVVEHFSVPIRALFHR